MMNRYQWTDGSGFIVLNLTMDHANMGHHMGQCDSDIAYLRGSPEIKEQLDALNPETVKSVLGEYGAWDDLDLSDHDANLSRLLWIACGDVGENPEFYQG